MLEVTSYLSSKISHRACMWCSHGLCGSSRDPGPFMTRVLRAIANSSQTFVVEVMVVLR